MRVRMMVHGAANGARRIADTAGWKRLIRNGNSRFRPREDDVLINWGCNPEKAAYYLPRYEVATVINSPEAVYTAQNKIRSLEAFTMNNVRCPEYTEDVEVVRTWLDDDYVIKWGVVCREILNGSGGDGCYWLPSTRLSAHLSLDRLNKVKLFTKYMPKFDEYRVHVMDGAVIDVQQKKMKKGLRHDANLKVRSYERGWIYARADISPPDMVLEESIKACAALGLDFGAVDIGWARTLKLPTVYEVNTAPGVEGSTVDSYANGFKTILEEVTKCAS